MKVLFGDLKLHYETYKREIDSAVQRVLSSGYYILGPELKKLEEEFAQYLGCKFAVGCASGTEAIYLALAALDITKGDQVITVAHTAVPTISAISMTGATPVFVDIDPVTCLMDVSKVEAKITEHTKAIVPVHLYGKVVDMKPLLAIAQKHNIPVLEDVAQGTGATYGGAITGSIGRMGAFSFYPSKNIGAFGDAGAVSTNSQEDYEKLLKLRNYGQSKRYHHEMIGINSRLDEMQAAILTAQLPFLNEWNKRRVEIARRYQKGLASLVQTPPLDQTGEHVYHLYVIQVDDRDALQAHLLELGIQTLIHYPIPAHLQNAYQFLGYEAGDLPVTEKVAGRILSLPMFPELTDDQIDLVIAAITDYYGHSKPVASPAVSEARR